MRLRKGLERKLERIEIRQFFQKSSKKAGVKPKSEYFCPYCMSKLSFSDASMYSFCKKCDKIILKNHVYTERTML